LPRLPGEAGIMGRRVNGEGNIYQRKDGLYEARYTVQTETGRKRRSVYAKTRREAAKKLSKALANREKGLVLDAGLSPRSVQYIHTTLKKALKAAVLDGLIPRNVTDALKPPQVHKDEVVPFTPDQVKALLAAAGEAGELLEALVVVAIHTGLRQGELLGLKWVDLDLDEGKLTVQR
jgi:integrase